MSAPDCVMETAPVTTVASINAPAFDRGSTSGFVLHVRAVTGTGGGPEKTILNSPRFLRTLNYDCACAYLHPPNDPGMRLLADRAADLQAELISVPDRGAVDWRSVRHLLRICRERQVTVWHGHDHKSNAIGLLLRRFHPMKVVSTVHGWIVNSRRLAAYRAIDLACLRHCDEVVCVSDALFDECISNGVPLERCRVIENAIDLQSYASLPDRDAMRRRWGVAGNSDVLVAVGRLSPEKGFDVLIQSVTQLIESGSDVRLLIAGDGPERAALEAQIAATGLADRIRLLGNVSDPRTLYAAANVFVLSSRREGLPNVLLEAMACRVPVVATAVGGVPRVVTDEADALLVGPDDADALAAALLRVLNNEALKRSLTDHAWQTLEVRYSFQVRMQRMAAVYDEVLERDSASRDSVSGLTTRSVVPLWPAIVSVTEQPQGWDEFLAGYGQSGFPQWPAMSNAVARGLKQRAFWLQARRGEPGQERVVGVLPLQLVQSRLFDRFLVSLPYVNTAGVLAESDDVARALVDRAIQLADALDVKHLELRHEQPVDHPRLTNGVTDKVHMRLPLPGTSDELWDAIKAKVRNQIRKAQKNESFSIHWGGEELLGEFYDIFCRNMRDLGTPPFSRELFAEILRGFPGTDAAADAAGSDAAGSDAANAVAANALADAAEQGDGGLPRGARCHSGLTVNSGLAEICVVRLDGRAVASGLLIHGPGSTQVPSASSLREFNATNANMLLYWNLLSRSIERGQREFDFGRSSRDSGTWRFKTQWGAVEHPAVWQHYVRRGEAGDMRPTSRKFQMAIKLWMKLPVWLTRLIGPAIVRGIP